MTALVRPSLVEETCLYLRRSAGEGRWPEGRLPPVRALAASLKVAPNTIMAALRRLDAEGFLTGRGRGRRIARGPWGPEARKSIRIGILLRVPLEKEAPPNREFLRRFASALENCGCSMTYAKKSSEECGGSVEKIRGVIAAEGVDAWMAFCLTEGEIRLLTATGLPVFCFAGEHLDLPVPATSVDMRNCLVEATRHLLAAGHRRIVFLAPPHWIVPVPRTNARNFSAELAAAGIRVGDFNLPPWDETPAGTLKLFEDLFRLTPPTAMIFTDYPPVLALQGFLAARGLSIPRDVSVVSMDMDPSLPWFVPGLAHFRYDPADLDKTALRWVRSVMRGESPPRQKVFDSEFVPAASIAPPPKR